MTGQMPEDVAAKIPGDTDKGETRCPTRDPPQEVVRSDQRHEEYECQPYTVAMRRTAGQIVDEKLDAVLRSHRTGNRGDHGGQDHQVRCQPPAKIAQNKGKRPSRV